MKKKIFTLIIFCIFMCNVAPVTSVSLFKDVKNNDGVEIVGSSISNDRIFCLGSIENIRNGWGFYTFDSRFLLKTGSDSSVMSSSIGSCGISKDEHLVFLNYQFRGFMFPYFICGVFKKCSNDKVPDYNIDDFMKKVRPFETFLEDLDVMIQDYLDQHGDLHSFEFSDNELFVLNLISIRLNRYGNLIDCFNGPEINNNIYGFNRLIQEPIEEPSGMIYTSLINHKANPLFSYAYDSGIILPSILLNSICGYGEICKVYEMSNDNLRILCSNILFLKDTYVSDDIEQFDEGMGIKIVLVNYYFGTPFYPDFGWIEPQVEGDIPLYM